MNDFYEYDNFEDDEIREEPIHFSAIFMDLNMPIMNGYDACIKIN